MQVRRFHGISRREALIIVGSFSMINYLIMLDGGWSPRPAAELRLDDDRPLDPADPGLITRIRTELLPPVPGPLNLSEPEKRDFSQWGIPDFVMALTRNKTDGFFVECGAYDGESMSNTLSLERQLGWTGLLVEPARQLFVQMAAKQRSAWLLEACLSDRPMAYTATFQHLRFLGTLKNELTSQTWTDLHRLHGGLFYQQAGGPVAEYAVSCYPLQAMLDAIGVRSVDFFSLDVEGVELSVVASIPWQQLDIKIVAVETFMGTGWNSQMAAIIDVMERNGYLAEPLFVDWLFVKRDSEYADGAAELIRSVRAHMIRSSRWLPVDPNLVDDPAQVQTHFLYSRWISSSFKGNKMDLEA